MSEVTDHMGDGFYEIPVSKSYDRPLRKFLDHVDPENPISLKESVNYFNKIPGVSDSKGYFSLTKISKNIDYTCGINPNGNPVGWHHGEEGYSTKSGTLFEWEEIERVDVLRRFESGILIYLEVPDKIEERILRLNPPVSTRTLGEFFKLAIEWAEAPGDAEASVVFRDVLSEMDMPEDVYNSFKNTFPDGPVNKFLKGNKRANVRNKEIPMMTPEQEDFVIGLLLEGKGGLVYG